MAALRAKRDPPFTRGIFLGLFGFGALVATCGAWSTITHYGERGQLYYFRIDVLAWGVILMGLAVLGRYLELHKRKPDASHD